MYVLRLGHRIYRDLRVTTHCGLAARALGAKGIILSGQEDPDIVANMKKLKDAWGGDFEARYEKDWKNVIRRWKTGGGQVALATMYGINLDQIEDRLKASTKNSDLLIVIGSEKVPGEVYDLVDFNVAVTHQPHSEVAALALILDRIFSGKELGFPFRGGKIKIKPKEKGKEAILKRHS